jgi:hypothetical protein
MVPANFGRPLLTVVRAGTKTTGWLLVTTPVFILIAHYMAVLPHESGHSFMAWATGIKANPWNIEWGDGSVGDILLLRGIDENVDYQTALTNGHNAAIAATVMAGPGMNALMFLFVRFAAPL